MAFEPPRPRPNGVSQASAIELCREWMVFLGAWDTVVASGDARASCDLYGSQFVAWVDNSRGNLGLDLVERAVSVSSADGRRPLIFVRGGVLNEAKVAANDNDVALFSYITLDGSLEGANPLGYELRARGLA